MGGIGYGAPTAAISTAAAIGEALLAAALVRHQQAILGGSLAVAAAALVVPAGWSFLVFGLAWTAIGLIQWRDLRDAESSGPGIA